MPKIKEQIRFTVVSMLIRAFVFATQLVQFIYFLNPKFSASIGETLDSVSTVFNEIAQHPTHTLFTVCNWSIGHPR